MRVTTVKNLIGDSCNCLKPLGMVFAAHNIFFDTTTTTTSSQASYYFVQIQIFWLQYLTKMAVCVNRKPKLQASKCQKANG